MLDYVVRMTTDDAATRDRFVAWLRGGHIAEVVAAGAVEGHAVREDGGPPYAAEARYLFASREAFAAYEATHAPRLRDEGKQLFAGVTFVRRLGERVK